MQEFWFKFFSQASKATIEGDEIRFNDQDAGYNSIENNDSIIPLSQLAFVAVHGPEAAQFLQGQFTCDIPNEQTQSLLIGAHCSVKGKIQNLFRIVYFPWADEPCYVLMFHHSTLGDTIKRLKKYAAFSKVTIDDYTNQLAAFVLNGEQSEEMLTNALHISPPDINQCVWDESSQSIVAHLRGERPRFLFIASHEKTKEAWATCAKHFKPNNTCLWHLLEIRAGIPIIFPKTVDLFFPHYLNLPTLNGVSFEKGCYLGQEVIARMQYRGKVNKHLHRGFISNSDSAPLPGTDIVYAEDDNQHPVGTVVVASPTLNNDFELLLVLKDEHKSFENLYVESADGPKLHHLNLMYNGN